MQDSKAQLEAHNAEDATLDMRSRALPRKEDLNERSERHEKVAATDFERGWKPPSRMTFCSSRMMADVVGWDAFRTCS